MATAKQIASLSILIEAATKGAVDKLQDLAEIGKEVGPKMVQGFKNSSVDMVSMYDKMLSQIASSFARTNFSQHNAAKLDQLKQFYKTVESTDLEAIASRAKLVDQFMDLYNQRHLRDATGLHSISQPAAAGLPVEIENAYNRLEQLQKRLASSDDVAPLIQRIQQLNSSFQAMSQQGLPLAAAGLERVKLLMADAQRIGNANPVLTAAITGTTHVGNQALVGPHRGMYGTNPIPAVPLGANYPYTHGLTGGQTYVGGTLVGPHAGMYGLDPTPRPYASRANDPYTHGAGGRTVAGGGMVGPHMGPYNSLSQRDIDSRFGPGIADGDYGPSRADYRPRSLEDMYRERAESRTRNNRTYLAGGTSSPGEWATHKQINTDIRLAEEQERQAFAMTRANAMMPGIFSPVQAAEARRQNEAASNAHRTSTISKEIRGSYTYTGGSPTGPNGMAGLWQQQYQGPSPFERYASGMTRDADSVQELRKVRSTLEKKNRSSSSRGKVRRQLDIVNKRLARAQSQYKFHGDDVSGSVSTRSGKGGVEGSRQRNFRYASSQLGYGFEDAAISYQIGGVAGAARAATNNATAIAGTMIANPVTAVASVIGITIAGLALPPLIEWISQTQKGKDSTKEFAKSYEDLVKKTQEGVDIDKIIRIGSLKETRQEIHRLTEDLEDIDTRQSTNRGEANKLQKAAVFYDKEAKTATNSDQDNMIRVLAQSMLGLGTQTEYYKDPEKGSNLEGIKTFADSALSYATIGLYSGKYSTSVQNRKETELNQSVLGVDYEKAEREKYEKQAQKAKLKAAIAEKKKVDDYEEGMKQDKSDMSGDIGYDERFRGKKYNEKEYTARVDKEFQDRDGKRQAEDIRTGKATRLANGSIKYKLDEDADSFRDFRESETKDHNRMTDRGVKDIRLRKQERANEKIEEVRMRGEQKKFGQYQGARDFANKLMVGEEDGTFANNLRREERDKGIRLLPAGTRQNELLKASALQFQKDEIDASARKNPYQRKPMNEGVDVGSEEDVRLQNHYAYGKPKDPAQEAMVASLRAIEGYLRQMSGGQLDESQYDIVRAEDLP